MKRVSFKVAKAIKNAGYPLEIKLIEEAEKLGWNDKAFFTGMATCALLPTCIEVWLWLWREKGIYIDIASSKLGTQIDIWDSEQHNIMGDNTVFYSSPEEAIIAAIEHLTDNDLIN